MMKTQLTALFDQYAREHHFSGAALIQKGTNPLFAGAYGFAHRGFHIPNQLHTMFDTASITKLFTTVAILQLVDQGKLSIDDCITDIIDLTGTCIPTDVTIAHLLTHTSGIADDADEEEGESYEDLFIQKPNYSIRHCVDFLPQFAYKEPKFKAGTSVSYNNCAFVLLGLAIEQVAQVDYRSYVQQHVFLPAGMNSTAFCAKDEGDAPIAEGYSLVHTASNEIAWRKNIYSFPPIGTADGGAFTTVGDLDRFMRAIIACKLLSEAQTQELLKPHTTLERRTSRGETIRNGYGFHFLYDANGQLIRLHKEGANAGVAAMFAYYPTLDATSTILANQTCNVWELHRQAEQILLEKH
ncbi:serine hydrolase domain-containing protein [Paenibacillus aquistagni]|uniref:serine hydrolase domain-containing protein n=1 Tax=Paenibacillus aquistagni TaxID=1852522 RepID=UPI001F103B38|nr:beta-lactamase family protein [Paenibacillus aquistagni]